MLQLYTDMKVTTLKANAIVLHSVFFVFQNFTNQFHRYLSNRGRTLVGLDPVSILRDNSDEKDLSESVNLGELPNTFVIALCDALRLSAHKDDRSSKLIVLYKAKHIYLALLTFASASGFPVILSGTKWKTLSQLFFTALILLNVGMRLV